MHIVALEELVPIWTHVLPPNLENVLSLEKLKINTEIMIKIVGRLSRRMCKFSTKHKTYKIVISVIYLELSFQV